MVSRSNSFLLDGDVGNDVIGEELLSELPVYRK
jgi:hypothetical protein